VHETVPLMDSGIGPEETRFSSDATMRFGTSFTICAQARWKGPRTKARAAADCRI
jgi:hypothetical protein